MKSNRFTEDGIKQTDPLIKVVTGIVPRGSYSEKEREYSRGTVTSIRNLLTTLDEYVYLTYVKVLFTVLSLKGSCEEDGQEIMVRVDDTLRGKPRGQ